MRTVNGKMCVYMLLMDTAFQEVGRQSIKYLKMCVCFDPAVFGA